MTMITVRTAPAAAMTTIMRDIIITIMPMKSSPAGARKPFIEYDRAEINTILKAFAETNTYGTILRSKGIVALTDGSWIEFDLVPEETEVRETAADFTGRICVIGTDLKEDED